LIVLRKSRLAKKLVACITPSMIFDVDGILAWGGLLLCAGSAMAWTHNPTPEQKLAYHAEDTRHDDQLPSARTQPEPHRLLMTLDSPQLVICEN
jgi:hypothetical protein